MTDAESGKMERGRILLVEDHADTAAVMLRLLEKLGYGVQVANCLASARGLAQADSFDLLVCDIRLPDGSGLELMREMRTRREIRGIALSGMASDDDRKQSSEAGFERHLSKPIDFGVLRSAVEEMTGTG